MEFIVNQTKQLGVEAETPDEAIKKALTGDGVVISTNLSAMPRPKPPTPQVRQ